MNLDILRRSSFFSGLSDEDLGWLASQARPVTLQPGDLLMEQGTEGDCAYVILDGELEVKRRIGDHEITLAVREGGEVIGEMSLLDRAPRIASVRAVRESRLMRISRENFNHLLSTNPAAVLAVLHTVTARLRQNEALLHQREKMAALGTFSAGIAHELNNPAAAAQRNAAQLHDALARWQSMTLALGAFSLQPKQIEVLNALHEVTLLHVDTPVPLDPLTRNEHECDLQVWLEDRDVQDAWEIAPSLVTFGWEVDALEKLSGVFTAEQLAVIAQWLGAGCTVYSLLIGVRQSAERVSQIVKAVKTYSYLDQAPIQEIDVHEGLENTLIILNHRLKPGVRVLRQYAQNLPRIEAYASDLNQVWTNIIDNAIDAMHGKGELTLRTYAAKENCVIVEICDTGSGIPKEIVHRIFEPFFTTKPPGSGTGLGLNIAYSTVVLKHNGKIQVDSHPGATCFQVSLPTRLKES
jgi:signal transduction histidine kinase